jgi:RNase P/RNase MRP subunit p29
MTEGKLLKVMNNSKMNQVQVAIVQIRFQTSQPKVARIDGSCIRKSLQRMMESKSMTAMNSSKM